ncbi:MAG: hypothetical protein KJZ78_20890, partial [Bryobacteraceae bacterium]|nr:hypothetical protein [Bryobacteraceae bacterium]
MRSGLRSLLCAVLLIASVQTIEAQAIARLSSQPPLSPAEVAELETRVQSDPGDIATRSRLLTHYRDYMNPVFRAVRLRHILYLIEHSPASDVAASPLAYVYASGGPYADAADHELARNVWLRAADANRTDASVQVNAARFLYVEHPDDAEELLRRLVDQDPSNRLLASHLGFFYAMDILGMNGPFGTRGRGPSDAERLGAQARGELERTTNPLVLAAAATALPNLFMRSWAGRAPGGDPTVFQYSSTLMARARQLAPGEPELRGPMPLIHEFGQFTGS